MTRVKICGITRDDDARAAAQLGADFLGFIFVAESPRCVTAERARDLESGGATRVGVFRNAAVAEILRIAEIARLDCIQLHGEEDEDVVRAMPLPVIRAYRVAQTLPAIETSARYVMFDSGGGTGRAFDWSLLDAYDGAKPFFLAGGITPDNARDALRARPFAIDVASGVERAPGIKDHEAMKRLFEGVKR